MDAVNTENFSHRNHSSPYTRGFISERRRMNAVNVRKLLFAKENLFYIRELTQVRNYGCRECGRTFLSLVSLYIRKPIQQKNPINAVSVRKHLSAGPSSLSIRELTGENPFSCKECPKAFNRKSELTRHLRVHTGEELYQCGECLKVFSAKSLLIIHLRMHTGGKPYRCSNHGKVFTQKAQLIVH
uniref:C2H2-type domain-containing protein n=1 Tax=Molossus molossus TaxID=27622 RepID=A0A7J8C8G7_MOLMO|nr:hypothetical protein HJG59_009871 [Molossus molossus]